MGGGGWRIYDFGKIRDAPFAPTCADDSFQGVILHIDSPGGDYAASDIIYHEIKRLRERKPVVVVMGDTAASGGYYIAMAGEYVFAQPFTVTGSIGVFAGKISNARLLATLGRWLGGRAERKR